MTGNAQHRSIPLSALTPAQLAIRIRDLEHLLDRIVAREAGWRQGTGGDHRRRKEALEELRMKRRKFELELRTARRRLASYLAQPAEVAAS